jgi:hypothetical protein
LIAWTSPRTTQLLHEGGDLTGLAHIRLIVHQASGLSGKTAASALAGSRFGDCLTGSLGTCDPTATRDLVQSAQPILPEAQRDRWRGHSK